MTRENIGRGEFDANFEQTFDSMIFAARQRMLDAFDQQEASGVQFVRYELYNGYARQYPLAKMFLADTLDDRHVAEGRAETLEISLPVSRTKQRPDPAALVLDDDGYPPYMFLRHFDPRAQSDNRHKQQLVTRANYPELFVTRDPLVEDLEQKLAMTFFLTPLTLSRRAA
ncbi:MAG TPA: hypothetical protein VFT58_05210 [Nitrososphaera sp.]|nr:hypothetical protein [Nitrososphaera sp.]